MKKITRAKFFESANENARARTFDESDWDEFSEAWRKAQRYAKKNKPYYASGDAGGVANAYKFSTYTARWGVWVCPLTREAQWEVSRPSICGRNVPRSYTGGDRSYHADFRRAGKLQLSIRFAEEAGIDLWRINLRETDEENMQRLRGIAQMGI